MTVTDQLTDHYEQDIVEANPAGPEQPPRFKRSFKEEIDWANQDGPLYKRPEDYECAYMTAVRAPARAKRLHDLLVEWSADHPGLDEIVNLSNKLLKVAMHVRKHGVTEAGDGALYEILKLSREFEPTCDEFLQIEGSNT